MVQRHVSLAAVVVISLCGAGLAQAQITPSQVPVFIDTTGTTRDSFIAQPGGNPNSPIQISDGVTGGVPTITVRNHPGPNLVGAAIHAIATGAVGVGVWGESVTGNAVFARTQARDFASIEGWNIDGGTAISGFASGGARSRGVVALASLDRVSVDSAALWANGKDGIGVAGFTGRGIAVYGNTRVPDVGYAGVFQGKVKVNVLGTGGSTSLCRNGALEIATCSSSLRYKTDVRPFAGGLEIVRRLRPIAFRWKQDGKPGIGLAAEDVEQVEPRLASRNDRGDVEGVRYNELSAVFVNAFAEQQAQIQRQQEQINRQQHELEVLKMLVCSSHPDPSVCR